MGEAGMGQYVIRRLLMMIPVVVIVSMIAFSLLYLLPGDPALAILGSELAGDQALYAQLRAQLGLNDPLYVQYVRWLGQVLHGNLGTSVQTREPVLAMILLSIPVTAELALLSLILAIAIGLSAAVVSALRPGTALDVVVSVFSLAGLAMPVFWLGILLIYAFSIGLHLLPPTGYTPPAQGLGLNLEMMVMPALTIGTGQGAIIMRQARAALLEVLEQDYIRTARAKGVTEKAVIYRHALKNAMIPVATIIGLQVGNLLAGSVITESIFALPGVGRLIVNAIFLRDYPTAQGAVLLVAIVVLIVNFLTDIFYAYLDPRIRYA